MGQIVGTSAKVKRCNLNAIQTGGSQYSVVLAAGEYMLVSSDNSMTATGNGNFDSYILGDGTTPCGSLTIMSIVATDATPTEGSTNPVQSGGVWNATSHLPKGGYVIGNPLVGQTNIKIKADGTTATATNWYISAPIALKKGQTIKAHSYGNSCAWLSYASETAPYSVIITATAYSADFQWTATQDCEVVMSGEGSSVYKYQILDAEYKDAAPIEAWEYIEEAVKYHPQVTMVNNARIIGLNNSNLGVQGSDTSSQCSDYIDIEGATDIYISVYGTTASSNNYGLAFYNSSKTAVSRSGLTFFAETQNNNSIRHIIVPTGAKYVRSTILKSIGGFDCYWYKPQRLQDAVQSADNIQDLNDGLLSKIKSQNLIEAFHDFRYVDIMYLTANSNAPKTKIGLFTPTSATATSLTFSSEDAACLDKQLALVCHTSDDDYLICQFDAASGNSCTLLFDYGENIDLTSVTACMALHDTIEGGNGQHLSPWGYKAIAQAISKQSTSKHWMFNRVITGVSTIECAVTDYNEPDITSLDGEELVKVTYNELVAYGGQNSAHICNSSTNKTLGAWYNYAYFYRQTSIGAKMQFPFDIKRKFQGFVKIVGCASTLNSIKINIYADGVQIYSEYAPTCPCPIFADVTTPAQKIVVEVETITASAAFIWTSISIVENYSDQIKPIDSTSIVACYGSSNTQYPLPNASYIGIVSGDPFNTLVTRPDGTDGDGYGYYPKELAKVTGAVVDNWGKSGERTEYGLEHIHGIFDTKRYTHIIFTFFGNDLNGTYTYEQVINNIWEMCEYAKGHGAIPIIVTAYGTAAGNQTVKYGKLHEFLMQSISKPIQYT